MGIGVGDLVDTVFIKNAVVVEIMGDFLHVSIPDADNDIYSGVWIDKKTIINHRKKNIYRPFKMRLSHGGKEIDVIVDDKELTKAYHCFVDAGFKVLYIRRVESN